jgi:hypothetical protein
MILIEFNLFIALSFLKTIYRLSNGNKILLLEKTFVIFSATTICVSRAAILV